MNFHKLILMILAGLTFLSLSAAACSMRQSTDAAGTARQMRPASPVIRIATMANETAQQRGETAVFTIAVQQQQRHQTCQPVSVDKATLGELMQRIRTTAAANGAVRAAVLQLAVADEPVTCLPLAPLIPHPAIVSN